MQRAPTRLSVIRKVERLTLLPLSIASGILGAVAVGYLFDDGYMRGFDGRQLVVVGAMTTMLTWCALRLALRRATTNGVVWRTVAASLLFAVLNSPLSFLAVSGLEGPGSFVKAVPMSILVTVVGLLYALPLGLLWGLVFAGPMAVLSGLRREPTLDGPDRAVRAVSGVLTLVCGVGAFIGVTVGLVSKILVAMAIVSAVAFIVASARLHYFERFLARVRLGVVKDWAIIALCDLDDVPDDLPITDQSYHPDAVLVRSVKTTAAGAYRTNALARIPWARTRL
jgi:hypothetical protein